MHIVVELPAPRAVFVAAGGMLREMLRLFGAQVFIFAAHAFQGIGQRRVAARTAGAHRAAVADPILPALLQRLLLPFRQHFRRGPQAFDGDHAAHIFRVQTGIAKRNIAAQGMRHDGDGRQFELMDDLREIIDIGAPSNNRRPGTRRYPRDRANPWP